MAAAVAAAPPAMRATPAAGSARHRVDIQRLRFVPERLALAPGDIVVWVNRDLVSHTITAADGSWDSRHVGPGETWELRVTGETPGTYFCRYHPTMRGQLGLRRTAQTEGGRSR